LAQWFDEVDTDPDLRDCIIEYTEGRGYTSMLDICVGLNLGQDFRTMAIDQDKIGWRRFMEGMVFLGMRKIQTAYSNSEGSCISPILWTQRFITKLLKITHSQWMY
jgi:hypothetical protein